MLTLATHDDDHCRGFSFSITDEEALAQAVALVLVQEYTLASSLVAAAANVEPDVALDKDDINDIVERRLRPRDDYHRDGFLFQLIMWLAAHLDRGAEDVVALPHSQAAGKGQDSLVLHCADNAITAISICEDKATENPRATVRDDVWPEIKDYEGGGRRDELRSNIIATLGLSGIPKDKAVALVRRISWDQLRRYRVRVTLEQPRTAKLFKGFDEIVAGNPDRRRGETVHIPNLRQWMNQFTAKVERVLFSFVEGD